MFAETFVTLFENHFITVLPQLKPLNMITLEPDIFDHMKRMITKFADIYVLIFSKFNHLNNITISG